MVGMTGFEPAISCSQSKRSTKLSYIPFKNINNFCMVGIAGFEPAESQSQGLLPYLLAIPQYYKLCHL